MIIAIDPGSVSGAYAGRNDMGDFFVNDLPVVDGQVNAAAFAGIVSLSACRLAVIERVGAMPKQGIVSTFKFGRSIGIVEGVLAGAGVSVVYVAPQTWKKHFKLVGTVKERSRALAIQRHPTVQGLHLKKHHGRAEALLMLDWYIATGDNR